MSGLWITFEGIEGSGKSTQIERLASALRARGQRPVVTQEPGGTDLGRQLRALLLRPTDRPMHPTSELMLYVADRAEHLSQVILPALERGELILCDRYLDATLAYQGYGRDLGVDRVLELHRRPPLDQLPRRTLLLDLDPRLGLTRARRRNTSSGLQQTEGRFEEEQLEFHDRVRSGYLRLARGDPQRFRVIDAGGAADEVEQRVREALDDLLPSEENGRG